MSVAFEALDTPGGPLPGGRILIVDDDPMVAGMLGISLASAGYEISEAYSGEAALELLEKLASSEAAALPDIVFLDIEMGMGIDGYETCRRLRDSTALRNLPVIFLSGHDQLEDRLQAYDAGGSDFMAKPFVPTEVLRKARLAIEHQHRQGTLEAENRASSEHVQNVNACLGDSGITFKFCRGALGCRSLRAMAALLIESMGLFGIACHVQLRTSHETLTLTPHGPATPLEASVIEMSRTIGRIFSFKNRLIVNYDSVSLLVTNMPTADDVLCGRIRDEAAMIAEAAELAIGNINLRTDAVLLVEDLRELAAASRQAVLALRGDYRALQVATRLEFETMTSTIEAMYVHLALSNHQEFTISDTVRGAVDRVLTLFAGSNNLLDHNFAGIVADLSQASELSISQEDEPSLNIQIF
jgi:CheY-like chemotaxis protein